MCLIWMYVIWNWLVKNMERERVRAIFWDFLVLLQKKEKKNIVDLALYIKKLLAMRTRRKENKQINKIWTNVLFVLIWFDLICFDFVSFVFLICPRFIFEVSYRQAISNHDELEHTMVTVIESSSAVCISYWLILIFYIMVRY